jgi:hypothetical protein
MESGIIIYFARNKENELQFYAERQAQRVGLGSNSADEMICSLS